MKPELQIALHEAADNSMGIYPQSFNGEPRTPWQDGWNAYGLEQCQKRIKIDDWFHKLEPAKAEIIGEMLIDEAVSVRFDGDEVSLWFNTSDLFAWGYSDCERITDDDMLRTLYAAWKKHGSCGMCAWWCKHENEKPQWPVEKQWREQGIWDAELEALPECKYDEKIGRWSKRSKAEAIADMHAEAK